MIDKVDAIPETTRFIALYIPITDKDSFQKLRHEAIGKCAKYSDVVVKLGDIEKEFEIDDFLQRLGF